MKKPQVFFDEETNSFCSIVTVNGLAVYRSEFTFDSFGAAMHDAEKVSEGITFDCVTKIQILNTQNLPGRNCQH